MGSRLKATRWCNGAADSCHVISRNRSDTSGEAVENTLFESIQCSGFALKVQLHSFWQWVCWNRYTSVLHDTRALDLDSRIFCLLELAEGMFWQTADSCGECCFSHVR